jgi:hypothetical protein
MKNLEIKENFLSKVDFDICLRVSFLNKIFKKTYMGQYHPLPQPCLTYTSLISLMGLLLKKK